MLVQLILSSVFVDIPAKHQNIAFIGRLMFTLSSVTVGKGKKNRVTSNMQKEIIPQSTKVWREGLSLESVRQEAVSAVDPKYRTTLGFLVFP